MIAAIIFVLIVLWFLGYIRVGGLLIPDYTLFTINGNNITLWNVLLFLVILWAIGALPHPLRQIAAVLFILWILSTVGIIAIAGLSNLLVIALIVGLIVSLFSKYY